MSRKRTKENSGGDKLETVDVGRGEDYVKKNINFDKKIDDKFKAAKKDSCNYSQPHLVMLVSGEGGG